jgi:hypothetical protein
VLVLLVGVGSSDDDDVDRATGDVDDGAATAREAVAAVCTGAGVGRTHEREAVVALTRGAAATVVGAAVAPGDGAEVLAVVSDWTAGAWLLGAGLALTGSMNAKTAIVLAPATHSNNTAGSGRMPALRVELRWRMTSRR